MKVYDKDIRKMLVSKFLTIKDFASDPTTKLIYEMDICFGYSRVDMAIVNGKMHGYEIKSERDTLERLPSQVESYNKIFDTITLVVADNHLDKVNDIIPEFWGIYSVNKDKEKAHLVRRRQAKKNPNIDVFSLSQLLWKEELLDFLSLIGIVKGVKSKTRHQLGVIAVENDEQSSLKDFVRRTLKSRINWKAVELTQLNDDLLKL